MIDKKHKGRSTAQNLCPSCSSGDMEIFYRVRSVPTNSVLQVASKEEALNFPTGDISLGFCSKCYFIWNLDFKPVLTEYSDEYESTQAYSPTFNAFNSRLAQDLVTRYGLVGKRIIEIGCGNGEFINLLCELGGNSGLGFDPAYREGRIVQKPGTRLEFVRDFYSDKYSDHSADFIVCKMTLEHIKDVFGFLATIRKSVVSPKTKIFIQVPNSIRILKDIAFWDIYYEHCSYFTFSTLSKAIFLHNFNLIESWSDYNDQYIMSTFSLSSNTEQSISHQISPNEDIIDLTLNFNTNVNIRKDHWHKILSSYLNENKRIIVWGGGSKTVSFLTTLNINDAIDYVIDINPKKNGTYLPKTGHKIVNQEFLNISKPDVVIVANNIYLEEVRCSLINLNLKPIILTF